jgi:hypothetical protein
MFTLGVDMTSVTFLGTIKPYFTTCYRERMMFYCDLWSSRDCQANWQDIYDSVANGSMPKPGCPEGVWDTDRQHQFLSDFRAWKDGGYQ